MAGSAADNSTLEPPATAVALPMDAVADFCRRWRVASLALFGSVLRNDFRADSDVDVMVVFEPQATPSLFDLEGMRDELKALFGREVDLLTRNGVTRMLNEPRKRAILDTARVIYAR